jgi:hypothetical protein
VHGEDHDLCLEDPVMQELRRRTVLGGLGSAALGIVAGLAPGRPAFAATTLGIDYSYGRPRPSAIAAAGYSFVCRYLSGNPAKNLTAAEADALRAPGRCSTASSAAVVACTSRIAVTAR